MPAFISKLQYKTYEKGEYSDEKARTLEETIELIKAFPWEEQRGVDVQLTGPSVTIQDEYGNYLKAGLYFNGKFCLYYFDCDHHLYEYHASDLEHVNEIVNDFFNGEIDLQKFEKNIFSMGAKNHFENAPFDYTISLSKYYFRLFLTILALLMMTIPLTLLISLDGPILFKIIFLSFSSLILLLGFYSLFFIIKVYLKSKNMFLHISAGNNEFKFSNNDDFTDYNKSDIGEINIYGNQSTKGSPILSVIEINFNNGTQIKFPGLLIEPLSLTPKFKNTKINFFQKPSEIRKARWNY